MRSRIIGWVTGGRTRWAVVLAWIALAVTAAVALPSITKVEAQNPGNLPASASSVVAQRIEHETFGTENETPGLLVFHRAGGFTPLDLTLIHRSLRDLTVNHLPLEKGSVPFVSSTSAQLSHLTRSNHSTLVVPLAFANSMNSKQLSAVINRLGQTFERATGANLLTVAPHAHRLSARLTGPEGISIDTAGLFRHADVTLLAGTTLLILVLLLLIYRSPVLPWIPLLSVGLSYLITTGILGLLAQAHAIVIDAETVSIMTVLMFGAGTDYTLFVISRYRSELWQRTQPNDALTALTQAYRHVSTAVAMSAGTVMVALLTLLVSIYGSDHQFAVPFALGVGVTAVASLTLVPALLSILGRPAFWPYIPRPDRLAPRSRTRLANWVIQHPWRVLVLVTVILGVLALNTVHMHSTVNLLSELPRSSQSVQGYRLLERAEGAGALSPVTVVVKGPGASRNLQNGLSHLSTVRAVSPPEHGMDQGVPIAVYSVTLRQNPLSNAAMGDLRGIDHVAHRLVSPGTTVYLGGTTVQNANSTAAVAHDTRWVIPLVLSIIFALLLFYLRSLVAALYLVASVILSFFAALGAGWLLLHNVLGISGWADGVTLYAFVFLVALGEDYNIFMISAIWQQRHKKPMSLAIHWGIQQSGPVISAAGLILAGTFAVLTGLPLRILLEFGVVAAIGVLLDTFLVRSMLVPAITVLLQDRALWPGRAPALPATKLVSSAGSND